MTPPLLTAKMKWSRRRKKSFNCSQLRRTRTCTPRHTATCTCHSRNPKVREEKRSTVQPGSGKLEENPSHDQVQAPPELFPHAPLQPARPPPERLDFPCLLAVNISCHVAAAAPRQPYLLLARRRARRPLGGHFILHFQLTVVCLLHKRIHHAAAPPSPSLSWASSSSSSDLIFVTNLLQVSIDVSVTSSTPCATTSAVSGS